MMPAIRISRTGPSPMNTLSSSTTISVPSTAPSVVPMPPITIIASSSSNWSIVNSDGDAPCSNVA